MSGAGAGNTLPVAKPSGDSTTGQKSAPRIDGANNGNGTNVALFVKQPSSAHKATIAASQPQTEQPDPYKFRNLKAQEAMAYWSMWMFVAALLTFIVTSIGTILIWRQVRLTRQAVEDTGEATDAMREANAIAKEANNRATTRHRAALIRETEAVEERRAGERRQLRAYVDFKVVEQVRDERPAKPHHTWRGVLVELWNYGQTPADRLELKLVFFLNPKGGEITQFAEETKSGLGGVMPSGSITWKSFIDMSDEIWQKIGDEKTEFHVSIVATYKDAFDESRVLASVYVANGWKTEMGFVPGSRTTT